MYLKSLVLKGFKSFADRSVLSMEPGITAIVGPNGSGKSNISDAVLWVLGERNAKHLRGQSMEDVIFSGSSARKATGVAEVTLVLDNSDGTLPVDFDEVAITRRMYRSGESEYLINNSLARRMDVLDILHDSGLGTGTHSIISQGSLDSILQSKPEDRRALIEEAAGVLKHKQRKAKSERKLANMDAHLTRVKDVANEVNRQLGPLERKAKRAQAYKGVADELAELDLALAVDNLRRLQIAWNTACANESAIAEEIQQRKAAVEAAEALVEQLQETIRKQSVDSGEISRMARRAVSAVDRFDSAQMLLRERRRAAQSTEADLKVTLESNKAKRNTAAYELEQAQAQMAQAAEKLSVAESQVNDLRAKQTASQDARRKGENEMEELEHKKRADERALQDARNKLSEVNEILTSGLAHAKLVESRSQELELALTNAQEAVTAAGKDYAALKEQLEQSKDADSQARVSVAQALRVRDEARQAYDEIHGRVTRLSNQITGLEEVERAAVSAGPARSWLLKQSKEAKRVCQELNHVVKAPAEYDVLVEGLLGDDISALLVNDGEVLHQSASALIDSGEQGRVTLVACTPEKKASSTIPARNSAVQGCGKALIDLLEYPKDVAHAVEALLGDVVVCESIDAALLAQNTHTTVGARFATIDGSVVWPNGKVTLGAYSKERSEDGVLARARHLDELRNELTLAQGGEQEAHASLESAEVSLRDAQALSLACAQELAELRGKADSSQSEMRRAELHLGQVRKEFDEVEQKRSQAQTSIADARPQVQTLQDKITQLEKSLSQASERLEELQEQVIPLRKEAAQLRDSLADAKLNAATLRERNSYAERIVAARQRDLQAVASSDEQGSLQLKRKQLAQSRIEPLLTLMGSLADSARARSEKLEDEANQAENSAAGLHAQVNDARTAARQTHDAFDGANARLSAARVEKGRLEVQVDGAVNSIVHDLNVPLDHALEVDELEDRASAEEQASKLRRRIQNMGTINPDAAQEYETLKQRYDYLASQIEDLESARRSLSKIVRVIDARMKDDFVNTFEAVNANFEQIFAVLFPGGQAHLSLVDPDDLENTGVEVTAQPRGKRITKMMLMSGGEKSLTALALLFAVYKIRSTPFYILDEVEAALDDTNLRRLVAYINNLRDTTQLIMITHQRRTMEMADVLFGVSMQQDGVTKVISQKLDRALQYAEG